jgi:hypothetical protein
MTTRTSGGWRARVPGALAVVSFAVLLLASATEAQPRVSYERTQGISPAYEGWMENADGSYSIVFGYMNRNWEEELHIPVGPENYFSFVRPGELDDLEVSGYPNAAADQGQPTYFLPRRNRFIFNVRVPPEFEGGSQELVWTLTANGYTERAYGSLARDYRIDNMVMMSETGSLGAGSSNERIRSNEPPVLSLDGPREIRVRAGEPVRLAATVTDDGIPGGNPENPPTPLTPEQQLQRALNPPRRITVGKVDGLHLSWFVYRGAGEDVQFDPPQIKVWEDTRAFANSPWAPSWTPPMIPEDNRYVTDIVFPEPGVYILRGRAHDGGLFTDVDVRVEVLGPAL